MVVDSSLRFKSEIRRATLDEWAAAYALSPRATFFHGPRWSQIAREYHGDHSPEPIYVELASGSTAVLGITTAPTGIPGVRRRLVSPEGCCGGWCSPERLSTSDTAALAAILAEGDVIWRIGPADDHIPDAAVPGAREETTHLIDLRAGADAARKSWKPSARRAVTRALREDVSVREAACSDDWERYRRLYQKTVTRWKAPLNVYADRLFEIIPRVAGDQVLLLLAERGDQACAGAIVFVHGPVASYWHAAFDVETVPGAANALQWEAIGLLEVRAVETYDLLGSGQLPGVVAFKESIGGVPHRVRALTRSTRTVETVRSAKHLLERRRRTRT
jgi:Acetyltransferase (GNAT) domain